MEIFMKVLLFLLVVFVVCCLGYYMGWNFRELFGGVFGGVFGGLDAMTGFQFEAGDKDARKEVGDISLDGFGIYKNLVVDKLDVKGSAELHNCVVKKGAKIVGNLTAIGCDMQDIDVDGHIDFFRSKGKSIKLCGKMKSKLSELDLLELKDKCKFESMQEPIVTLKDTEIKNIKVPKGVTETTAIKRS